MSADADALVKSADALPADATVLMRWVASDPGRFRPDRTPALQPGAFIPNPADTDGLSMSLLNVQFRTPEAYLQSCQNERVRLFGGVATLTVAQMSGLGLTIDRTPTDHDAGHVSVRELNAADYAVSKQAIKAFALRLAELAVVVIEPKPVPPKAVES